MSFLRIAGVLMVAASAVPAATDPACQTAADAANWAQELTPDMAKDKEKLQRVLDFLRIGTERCTSVPTVAADAWYYRALLQHQLAPDPKEKLWLSRAVDRGSVAAKESRPLFGFQKTETKPATGPVREKWALVVGISKFANSAIPSLRYPAKDARDFAAVLKDPKVGRFKPDNVTLLLDQDATLVNIRKALGKIREQAQPDDLVLLYISSHGSPRIDDPRGVSYVVAYDTDISGADTIYATGLAMSEIINTLNRDVQAQRLALFLDTCFSGAAAPGAAPPGAKSLVPVGAAGATAFSGALAQFSATGWAAIAASRGDQRSWESDQLQQGYFTYYLIDALRKTQGMAPLQDLFQQLHDQVSAHVRQDKMPVMSSGADGAKLTLGVEARAARAALH